MNDEDLISYNALGLIPGPKETEEAYSERALFCLSLKKTLFTEMATLGATSLDPVREKEILAPVFSMTERLYGIKPDFVPLFFSNTKLAPWHGGVAWIFQLEQNSPLGALLQLRKAFYTKETYLGLYPRDELIAHELAHVGRMAFQEKKYEELLSYLTSTKGLSKSIGPIIQSAFESRLIVFLLCTLMIMDFYFLFQGSWNGYLATQWFKLVPLALIAFGFYRLKKRQRTLKAALANLSKIFGYKGSAVLYRLTDAEIDHFAKAAPEEIKRTIKEQDSLRFRVIRLAYTQVDSKF